MNPKPPTPPRIADRLLEWFVAPHLLETLQGDLHEEFTYQVERIGERRARWRYWRDVLGFVRPYVMKRKKTYSEYPNPYFLSPIMIRSSLKITWRNLLKDKRHTTINLIGLTLGLGCCLLISLYVLDELSYDRYSSEHHRVYRTYLALGKPAAPTLVSVVGPGVAKDLKNTFPEVEASTRLRVTGSPLITYGSNTFKEERFTFADANFFQLFTLPFRQGNAQTALTQPNSIVITDEMARKYFGDEDPMGKMLQFKSWETVYKVTGVINPVPANSHFHFDFFASMTSLTEANEPYWLRNTSFYTYVMLPENYAPHQLEAKLPAAVERYMGPEIDDFAESKKKGEQPRVGLQPVTDIHLRSNMIMEIEPNSNIRYVYIFAATALFILLIACVNFINLATASAARRAKEVGVRKVLGSERSQLAGQFLLDSFLLTVLAISLAMVVAWAALPLVNAVAGKQISAMTLVSPMVLLGVLGLSVLVTLLAGSYPAFYLSSFRPILALKGRIAGTSNSLNLRSSLVVFQFFVSVTLVVGTIVVYRQLQYMQNKNLGFDKEQVIVVNNTYALGRNEAILKEQLEQQPQIDRVSISGYLPINSPNTTNGTLAIDGANKAETGVRIYNVDYDYIPTLGMELAAGRNFSKEFTTDSSGVILNEAAVRAFGWKGNPVGQRVYGGADDKGNRPAFTVLGVVKNFHFESLHQPIGALAMFLGHNSGTILVKTKAKDVAGVLTLLRQRWERVANDTPFSYSFLNERFAQVYQAEQRTGQLLTFFALITIFIACLGLYGLATYVAGQRTKEIGVRKVLGASVASITVLLTGDFLKLVLTAIVLASPIAWWVMHQWLQDYAYKVDIDWWVFALAGVLAVGIALLTVSFQSIKAALMNPVKSLRSE